MARSLLADGRAEDVVRMIGPLLATADEDAVGDAGQALLRALMARVHVVHSGEVERALALLAPFDEPTLRHDFRDAVRAEIALWLGWAHARRDETFDEEARALHLLDEAHRLFSAELDASGRGWALVGRAQAYFAIDEYELMRQALDEAAALQHTVDDAQFDRWLHDLRVPALRFQGRYDAAQRHVDALDEIGTATSNREIQGRACAYQAALYLDRGEAPERVITTAERAETLLRRVASGVGYPLLAAYHAHGRALMLQGAWNRAEAVIEAAEADVDPHPTARAHLQTLRAQLALRRNEQDRAAQSMETLFEQAHHLPHGLQRSHVALLRGEMLARSGHYDEALAWIDRAYRNARETGHRGNQLRALLTRAEKALEHGDHDTAADALRATHPYDDYFRVLPFAAFRFRVLGSHARLQGKRDEARKHFIQSLSAYSLIGDVLRITEMQRALAVLDADASAEENPDANPNGAAAFEATIGAALAHASLSVRLVAEVWIRTVTSILPDRWIGVYRRSAEGTWTCVHEHDTAPPALSFPKDSTTESQWIGGIYWLPLHVREGDDYYLGVAVSAPEDPAWQKATARIEPWLPVLQLALDRALLRGRPTTETDLPAPGLAVDGFVYDSDALRAIAHRIDRMRSSYSPVLITGEAGVGKTTVARAIHTTSGRHEGPWRVVNCASVPPDPLAARLFGRSASDPGLLQQADSGTLFLQAVGALPLALQRRLLRVLETGQMTPIDAEVPIPVDVRLLASTTEDLAVKVHTDRFLEDLYYRLNVISLTLPPLRERRADIPRLVRHFLEALRPAGTPPVTLTNRALDALLRYDWPGNVRQLRNEIERALAFISSEPAPTVDVHLLSDPIRSAAAASPPAFSNGASDILHPGRDLSDVLARTEKDVIERVLAACDGQITASADVLGLTRQGLYKKMKRLKIDPAAFKHDTASSPVSH